MTANRSQTLALGAQATMHAAEGHAHRPSATPNEVPMSRSLSPFAALAGVDLRGTPITGAQCRFDPDLHTGPDGDESPDERAARELVAAEVCESCPLRAACFELAMRIRPEYGVWAGLTVAQLDALASLDLDEVA
ncbi:WhiB family transcriptional regulator [Actinomadura sp. 7K507]|uniref:WhiB family transcriptional regulator n=1 Tax=Actinomadura sp. 7K507 TaxID=2530365 RepID=UPI001049CE79|nr:WhiB family transcriptional regulator [Actinomadura sp. 7K507]TDC78660.1 WhiB family transcriptional regulator [Actinomadura sp. 7K507]